MHVRALGPMTNPIVCIFVSIDVVQRLTFRFIYKERIWLKIANVVTYSTRKNVRRLIIEAPRLHSITSIPTLIVRIVHL
jgi:hypothetical protein